MEEEGLDKGAGRSLPTFRARTRGTQTRREIAVVPECRPVRREVEDFVFLAVPVHAYEAGSPYARPPSMRGAKGGPDESAAIAPEPTTVGGGVGGPGNGGVVALRAIRDIAVIGNRGWQGHVGRAQRR